MHSNSNVFTANHSKMLTILAIKKAMYAMLFMGVIPLFAQLTASVFGALPTVIAVLFMLVIVSPEIGLVFPGFRKWIQTSLEDGDGRFDKKDLIDAALIYTTVLPVRAVSFGYIYMMVGGWNPTYDQLYGPLVASGLAGVASYLNKKK
jgi:hypothetical protein